jgi:hypothetical protein
MPRVPRPLQPPPPLICRDTPSLCLFNPTHPSRSKSSSTLHEALPCTSHLARVKWSLPPKYIEPLPQLMGQTYFLWMCSASLRRKHPERGLRFVGLCVSHFHPRVYLANRECSNTDHHYSPQIHKPGWDPRDSKHTTSPRRDGRKPVTFKEHSRAALGWP